MRLVFTLLVGSLLLLGACSRGRQYELKGQVLAVDPVRQELTRVPLLPLLDYRAPGGLPQDPGRAAGSTSYAGTGGNRRHEMRVALSTLEDVEPMVGVAVHSRALDAEVRACAPPDCAELLAHVGVLVTMGVWR